MSHLNNVTMALKYMEQAIIKSNAKHEARERENEAMGISNWHDSSGGFRFKYYHLLFKVTTTY